MWIAVLQRRVEVARYIAQHRKRLILMNYIKQRCGSSVSTVWSGTEIIGHFKGKVAPGGAKVDDFEGSDLAKKLVEDKARSYGVALVKRSDDEYDTDWDASEFYNKTNPGI